MKLSYPKFLRWAARLVAVSGERYGVMGIFACHCAFGAVYMGLPGLLVLLSEAFPSAEGVVMTLAVTCFLLFSLPVFPVLMMTTFSFAEWLFTKIGFCSWLSIPPFAFRRALMEWSEANGKLPDDKVQKVSVEGHP
jgi:hypothetical protein